MTKPRKKRRVGIPWVAAVTTLGIIVAGIAVWFLKPSAPPQVMRFDYDLPEGQRFSNLQMPSIAISPNGKHIVYSTPEGLYLRSTDELNSKLIAGTEGSTSQPFFSPDGKWIGYLSVSDMKMKKIDINGGAPVTLYDNAPYGAHWATDSTIVFGQLTGNIMRVSSNGGAPESFAETKNMLSRFPQMLPDGKTVMFTAGPPRRIVVQSLESGERKELFAGYGGRYVSTGYIVYGLENNNNLFAVPFDLDKLEVTGGAVPIVEGAISPHQCAFSDSGTLVYIPGGVSAAQSNQYTLVWVDRKGKEEPLSAEPKSYIAPKISPDGSKVALTIRAGEDKADIWIWDIVRETMTRLTFDERSAYSLWAPDSGRIAFVKVDRNLIFSGGIYWKAADGTGEEEKIGSSPDRLLLPWSWSNDGKTLALFEAVNPAAYDIGILTMEGEHERKALLAEDYVEFQPKISPDGKWLAYTSNESGQLEIYVRPFPDVNQGRWQISTSGGDTPLWSPDGHELFYLKDNSVIRVTVETDPTFKAGKPEILFQGNYVRFSTNDGQPCDISPDGKRFLMKKPAATADQVTTPEVPRKINIVLNWFEELKQRVPVD